MTEKMPSADELAQRAWDHVSIIGTLSRVAQAQDSLDPVAYRKCFADRVLLKEAPMFPGWTEKEISGDELTAMSFASLGKMDAGHHMVFNHIIEIDGDDASCVADLHAVSILHDEAGVPATATVGARYHLRLRREKDMWVIYERAVRPRYRHGDPELGARAKARAEARAQAAEAAAQ